MKSFFYTAVFVLIISFLIVSLLSCKKDTRNNPPLSAAGYWTGSLSTTVDISIVNRTDNTSRLYIMAGSSDTATATLKYDGTYISGGSFFTANYHSNTANFDDQVALESSMTNATTIAGLLTHTGTDAGGPFSNNATFNVTKQP